MQKRPLLVEIWREKANSDFCGSSLRGGRLYALEEESFMKIEVPEGAVQIGKEEDGRIAIMLTGHGMEGGLLLDSQEFSEAEAQELGSMLWRVFERWLVTRQPLK
jgi:hypothetical protein